ncbi:MAG: hypothetical protein K2K83_04660, partial [Rikenella sp.]|nr:hypothetical protein [Rikenella sp.]
APALFAMLSKQTATSGRAGQPLPHGWHRCRSALENWSLLRKAPSSGRPENCFKTGFARRPREFHLGFAFAKRVKFPFKAGGRRTSPKKRVGPRACEIHPFQLSVETAYFAL